MAGLSVNKRLLVAWMRFLRDLVGLILAGFIAFQLWNVNQGLIDAGLGGDQSGFGALLSQLPDLIRYLGH